MKKKLRKIRVIFDIESQILALFDSSPKLKIQYFPLGMFKNTADFETRCLHQSDSLDRGRVLAVNHRNLSQFFFSLKSTNLGAHLLLFTFSDNINFKIILFSKLMPNF